MNGNNHVDVETELESQVDFAAPSLKDEDIKQQGCAIPVRSEIS